MTQNNELFYSDDIIQYSAKVVVNNGAQCLQLISRAHKTGEERTQYIPLSFLVNFDYFMFTASFKT